MCKKLIQITRRVLSLAITPCVLNVALSANGIAETIYRCGNEYSYAQRCNQNQLAQPTRIDDQRLVQQEKAKPQTNSRDLRDAELLEKSRIQSERNAQINSQRRENFNNSKMQTRETKPQQDTPESPNHRRRRYPVSQYFTAKDPNATKKTK